MNYQTASEIIVARERLMIQQKIGSEGLADEKILVILGSG